MTYGIVINKDNYTIDLSKDSIIGLSYVQTIDESIGVTVDLVNISSQSATWDNFVAGAGAENINAYYTGTTTAKEVQLLDQMLNKDNIFIAVHSAVQSLEGVILEPWAMPGYFCIYDESKNKVYFGSSKDVVTCNFGATR